MHCWYWVADFCEAQGIHFILGHALYMRAIHGGKAKNDRIDSLKIAQLMRGGNFPLAYVYPREMRATRDLLRRRTNLIRHGANLKAHVANTTSQYNLPANRVNLKNVSAREQLRHSFPSPAVQKMIDLDRSVLECDHHESVQKFASYSRLVKCKAESAGKSYGSQGAKIGNAHLKWAFSEAAVLYLRGNDQAQRYLQRLQKRMSKAKALSALAHKLGRAAYFMLKNKTVFDEQRFLTS